MMPLTKLGIAGLAALLALSPVWAHGPVPQAAGPSTIPASARDAAATVDAFHEALHRGDSAAAAALLADDALIFEEGGAERSKAEYAAHHLPADAAFSQIVGSTVTRRAGGSSGPFAWIASEGRMAGTYKGKAVDRVTAESMLLRRIGTTWKIVHVHWSSAASPEKR